jgi:hypothetical protein
VAGDFALEMVFHDDGRMEVGRWRVVDSRDGAFWLCLPCWRMLARPEALLRRLMGVYT